MKHIERISDRQRNRADKRMKKNGHVPYWGAADADKYLESFGFEMARRIPLKFNPPISADWRRW